MTRCKYNCAEWFRKKLYLPHRKFNIMNLELERLWRLGFEIKEKDFSVNISLPELNSGQFE